MDIQFISAAEYIKLKSERTSIAEKYLELEEKLLKNEMLHKFKLLQYNEQKRNIIQRLKEVEKKQLCQYTLEGEQQGNKLIRMLNEPLTEILKLQKEIALQRIQCKKYAMDIENINKLVPGQFYITNCKMQLETCHQAAKV